MNSCFDVAKYILQKNGPMTTMKIHKLLYYCQAWSLVWDGEKIFKERIEAWINGPVIPDLYKLHSGKYKLKHNDKIFENARPLIDAPQKDTIDNVLNYYGDKDSQWLSDLTHAEEPWIKAREGLLPNERGCNEITEVDMLEYYSSIPNDI